MFRSKTRLFIKIFTALFLIFLLTIFGAFIYGFPDHPINVALFKFTYNFAPVRKSFLEFYSPLRRDVSNGNIPAEVDNFLCEKIERTTDETEVSAIVNFYTIQAGGREGRCIHNVSETTKQKIIAEIIRRMEDDSNLNGKIILLEEVKRGKNLGKGQIGPSLLETEKPSTSEEWRNWREKALPIAREKYKEWWNSNLGWEEKKKINSLEGTVVGVYECCG